jgi:hypothetical protein
VLLAAERGLRHSGVAPEPREIASSAVGTAVA